MGMHANKCIVQWKSTTSDQRIDLHMTKRKLNNLFNSKSGIEAGSASKKPRPDENSARSSSAASSLVPKRIKCFINHYTSGNETTSSLVVHHLPTKMKMKILNMKRVMCSMPALLMNWWSMTESGNTCHHT